MTSTDHGGRVRRVRDCRQRRPVTPNQFCAALANTEENLVYTFDKRFEGPVIDRHDANAARCSDGSSTSPSSPRSSPPGPGARPSARSANKPKARDDIGLGNQIAQGHKAAADRGGKRPVEVDDLVTEFRSTLALALERFAGVDRTGHSLGPRPSHSCTATSAPSR